MVALLPAGPASGPGRLSLTYLLLLAGSGAYVPFLTLHLLGRGWSTASVGAALTGVALVRLVSAPGTGLIADRLRRDDLLFLTMTGAAAVAVLVVATATHPVVLGLALLTVAAVRAPASIVLDSAIVRTLAEAGTPASHYGRVRLWGSVGYLASAVGVAALLGDRPATAVLVAAGFLLLAAGSASALGTGGSAPRARLGPALAALAQDRVLVGLLVAAALHGAALNAFDAWFPALLVARGWAVGWTGPAMVLGIGAEILALQATPSLRTRATPTTLLVLAGVTGAVRLLATALMPHVALVVAAQVLHGVALGVWWAAAVEATSTRVSPAVRASTQALLLASAYGVGPALTGILAAVLVRGDDPTPLFLAGVGLSLAGAIVALTAQSASPVPQPA
ncbi:MAG: MFS transporter [Alphaproteobacteria bacterium]|nr:MFS transporter [Alphaproteobacteria bacterium]